MSIKTATLSSTLQGQQAEAQHLRGHRLLRVVLPVAMALLMMTPMWAAPRATGDVP